MVWRSYISMEFLWLKNFFSLALTLECWPQMFTADLAVNGLGTFLSCLVRPHFSFPAREQQWALGRIYSWTWRSLTRKQIRWPTKILRSVFTGQLGPCSFFPSDSFPERINMSWEEAERQSPQGDSIISMYFGTCKFEIQAYFLFEKSMENCFSPWVRNWWITSV